MNAWTREQLKEEWVVIYSTRLGILCGEGEPTYEQMRIAREDADRHIAAIASNNPP